MQAICSEPALPRRKKHPEFAYRTNEVLGMVNGGGDSSDSLDAEAVNNRDLENRARSEERNLQSRNRVSPRSKSVDPYFGRRRPVSPHINTAGKGVVPGALTLSMNRAEQAEHRLQYTRRNWPETSAANPVNRVVNQLMTQSYPPAAHTPLPPPISSSQSATIRKVTEYRSQFAWPTTAHWMHGAEPAPRKSISMGAIQAAQSTDGLTTTTTSHRAAGHSRTNATASGTSTRSERRHVKLPADKGLWEGAVKDSAPEEPLLPAKKANQENTPAAAGENDIGRTDTKPTRKIKTEYKSKFRAPAKYAYVEGTWKKMSRSADSEDLQLEEPTSLPWYGEVVELRKKADEYKYRSLGSNIAPEQLAELYSRQEVYEQLSTRSNLSALALATTPRDQNRVVTVEPKRLSKKPLLVSANRGDARKGKNVTVVVQKDRTVASKLVAAADERSATTSPHLRATKKPTSAPPPPISWKRSSKFYDGGGDTPRSLQSSVRHHLERTTPASGETGVLIMSPTRDHKLEPVEVIKKPSRETKVSPAKTKEVPSMTNSRSAEKSALVKGTTTSAQPGLSVAQSRAASAGAAHRSPKKTPRPVSMIVPGSKSQVNGVLDGAAGGDSLPPRKIDVKRPRPTTLATSSTTTARPKTVPSIRAGKVVHAEENMPRVHGVETRSCPTSASAGASTAIPRHAPPPPPPPSSSAAAVAVVSSAHTISSASPAISSRPITSTSKPISVIAPSVHVKPVPVPSSGRIHSAPISASTPQPPTSAGKGVVMVNGDDTRLEKDNKGSVVENGGGDIDESKEIEETLMMKSPPEPTRVKSPEQILVRSPEPVKWTIPLETGIKWTGAPKIEGENPKTSSYEGRTPPSVASPVESPTCTLATHDAGVLTSPKSGEVRSPVGSMTSPSSSRSLASDVLEKARTRFDQFWGKSKEK